MTKDNITLLVSKYFYICASPENTKGKRIFEIELDCRSHLEMYLGIIAVGLTVLIILIYLAIKYRWHIKFKIF